MMKRILSELGTRAIGPFSRLAEAMVAAVHDEIDADVIDVNLGGEFVYPVADVLVARRIPFVLMTGHGVESIDWRFAYVPIVKEPVQRQVPIRSQRRSRTMLVRSRCTPCSTTLFASTRRSRLRPRWRQASLSGSGKWPTWSI